MIICLVFMGKVPTYIRYCVQQIKYWSSLPLYLITDDVENSKDLLVDFDINIVNSKDLNSELIELLEKQRNDFPTSNGLPGRENLFYYSFLRLFLIENLMKKYNINNVFHLEIDNLIYYDPKEFEDQFNSKGLSFIYENTGRGSAGIFYARDVESLNHLNMTTITYINKCDWNSEMEFLGKYADNHPDKIYFLPHCTPENSPLYNLSCNFKEFNNQWLFDPSSFGLWVTGIDGIHSDGILSYRKNNWCPAICTGYIYEWLIDDKGRRYITATTNGHKCRIFNLHVNCKDLKPHLSKKFKIPSNRTLLTDNSFIGISVKSENVELIKKYANRDNINYNEGPMNINYSLFNSASYEDYELYLQELIKNRFCICYRDEQILECVYLGVIPVVRQSPLMDSLKKFIKMVIYNDINNINLNYIPLPALRETIYTEDFISKRDTVVSQNNIISGETFQSIPGVLSLYSTDSYNYRKPVPEFVIKAMIDNLSDNDWEKLHSSKIIQIIIELLPYFVSNILPKLSHKFILIGHNCDFGIDSKFIPLLEDERIIHMFSQNTLICHNKLTPIPIGIANSKYNHGKKDILYRAVKLQINEQRINKIYVNVDPGTNWSHRGPVLNHMRYNPLSVFVNRSSYYDYLVQMKQYKWVCSPKGNGDDCHRTWEALYMGCIPLVDNIENFREFSKELPIILIDDWSKITIEFLEKETSKINFNYNMLNFNYWKNKIERLL